MTSIKLLRVLAPECHLQEVY